MWSFHQTWTLLKSANSKILPKNWKFKQILNGSSLAQLLQFAITEEIWKSATDLNIGGTNEKYKSCQGVKGHAVPVKKP